MDAIDILKETVEKIAAEHNGDKNNYKVKPINSGGANFTSSLFKVDVPTNDGELNLFAKVACIGPKMRTMIQADIMYKNEYTLYNNLLKQFNEIQDEYNLSEDERLKFPKSYGFNIECMKETVVLEDLTAQGFKCHYRKEFVTWEYAACAMEQLAKFSALSIAYGERNPEEYAKMLEEHTKQFPQGSKEDGERIISRALSKVHDEYKPAVYKWLQEMGEGMFQKWYNNGRKKLLNHGDYRPSNIMHRYKNGKLEMIPIDYQMIHTGSPITDILYFVAIATDKKFRDEHYEALINHYYSYLGKMLKLFNLNIDSLYPRKDFDDDLKELQSYVIFIAIFVLPIITVDESEVPTLSGADVTTENFNVPVTEQYVESFNDLLADCKKWGAI